MTEATSSSASTTAAATTATTEVKKGPMREFNGGCHCGAIRFKVVTDEVQVLDCNCSMCTKKGIIHLIVPPSQFTLVSGDEQLATYTFNTHIAKHHFCRVCGMHPFYRPRSHPTDYDVNVRCFDGDDPLTLFRVVPFNGRNWESNISEIATDDKVIQAAKLRAAELATSATATATATAAVTTIPATTSS